MGNLINAGLAALVISTGLAASVKAAELGDWFAAFDRGHYAPTRRLLPPLAMQGRTGQPNSQRSSIEDANKAVKWYLKVAAQDNPAASDKGSEPRDVDAYVAAATDCYADEILQNETSFNDARSGEWTKALIAVGSACDMELSAMVRKFDELTTVGEGDKFLRGKFRRNLTIRLAPRLAKQLAGGYVDHRFWLSPAPASLEALYASPAQPLPIRKGVWLPDEIGYGRPCLDTPLDHIWVWDGKAFSSPDFSTIISFRLIGVTRWEGYPQVGPVFRVLSKSKIGSTETLDRDIWTIPDEKTVILNADPVTWCSEDLAQLRHLRERASVSTAPSIPAPAAGVTDGVRPSLGVAAVSSIPSLVIDVDSGQVLSESQSTANWYPAALTELMTVYVALHAVRDGRVTMDTPFVVSPRAASMPASKMGFRPGVEVTLDNALKMLMVKSPNDVAVTVAEGVSGSVEAFADEMNGAAASLGLRESHFVNPNGLPDVRQVSSARDMAVIGRALLKEFPEQSDLFGIGALQLGDQIIRTHNGLIGGRYLGGDGMKTGFTCAAGFNVVASATHGGRRLIAVVLGSPSARERNAEAAALFDKAFNQWGGGLGPLENLPSPGVGAAPDMSQEMCSGSGRDALATAEEEELTTAIDIVPVPVFVGPKPGWTGPVLAARPAGLASHPSAPTQLQAPVAPINAPQTEPQKYTSEIPLRKHGDTFAMPVSINNVLTLDFVIDSGASDVSIPADVVLTLIRTGTLNTEDFLGKQSYTLADGSTVPSETFRIHTLKVGDREIKDVTGSVAKVEGSLLLGQSFLSRFKSWSIDNERNVLLLQ